MKHPIGLALLCLSTGCAGPRPPSPISASVTAPSQWLGAEGSDAASVDPTWWRSFGDPVLEELVSRTLANNIDIAVAAARVEEARAQFQLARAQLLPNVTATALGAEQRSVNAFGQGIDQSAGQAQLSIAYDLDLFGRLRHASEAVRSSLLATGYARDNVQLAIAASTASGYINLLALDARLRVLNDTLNARESSLKLIKRRADAGYAPALELRQAEAEYRAAEQLIPPIRLAIARQEHGLSLLLGDNPHAIERGAAFAALAIPRIAPGLPSALLRRRPDLAQAEQQLVASDRSLDSARAAFLPSIQLSGSGGGVVSSLLTDDPISIFSLGGSILAPIFDSGRLQAQQRGAAARRDQAAFGYRKAVIAAFREVEDGITSVSRLSEQEVSLSAQRAALEGAYELATNRYREGYSPYLEQLEAQRSLLSADLALLQVKSDRLVAAVTLYQALGGGWALDAADVNKVGR